MNNTTDLRRFSIQKIDNNFYLTGSRGATYVACQAFIGDDDTMKLVGGLRGFTSILRGKDGREMHISRKWLEVLFSRDLDMVA